MTREDTLRIIDEAYGARQRGDKEALGTYWAPEATFQLVGTESLLKGLPLGPVGAAVSVDELIDRFQFHEVERLDSVVEGNKAAVRWRIKVSKPGEEPETTELFDLVTLTDDGRIASLVQFTDTALVKSMM